MKQYTIKQGNNIDTLKEYPDNHFDSIVTDPPYGIEFLGKDWDSNTGAVETWEQCYRVLKPGGYILAFSAARTYHNLATNIESVGFEIRDQIMWLYSSGFPKAQDIGKAIDKRAGKRTTTLTDNANNTYSVGIGSKCSKCNMPHGTATRGMCSEQDCPVNDAMKPADNEWAGWKTALKPAHEPIVMARKPFKGSAIDNVLTHGVGALNIDASRIDWQEGEQEKEQKWREKYMAKNVGGPTFQETDIYKQKKGGNVEDAPPGRFPSNVLGEVEGYQKFFYCPKVIRAERHIGFETDNIPSIGNNNGNPMAQLPGDKNSELKKVEAQSKALGNNHPTVKPVELMKYLVKLVTPAGGKVLDPFTGSGSTGMAAVELGYDFTGCELDPDYVNIAETRIDAWYEHTQPDTTYNELFEEQ